MKIIRKLRRKLSFLRMVSLSVLQRGFFGIEGIVRLIGRSSGTALRRILIMNGGNIGKSVNFKGFLRFDNVVGDQVSTNDFSNLTIGNGSYIGRDVFFDLTDKIDIAENCAISAGTMFITHADAGDRPASTYYPRTHSPIIIGEGTWIGANATVLSGVKLGKVCVVGAGALVNKSFPDYSVIGGVPAKLISVLKKQE